MPNNFSVSLIRIEWKHHPRRNEGLWKTLNSQEIEDIFAVGDVDNDGPISLNEFIAVMYPSASTVVERLNKTCKILRKVSKN